MNKNEDSTKSQSKKPRKDNRLNTDLPFEEAVKRLLQAPPVSNEELLEKAHSPRPKKADPYPD